MRLPAVENLVAARSQVHTQVQEALKKSQQRMQGVANPRRRDVSFSVGDRVWLSTQHLPVRIGARKLAAKSTGPYRIAEVITDEAYRVELPAGWKVHDVFHTSQLKPVAGTARGEAPV